MKDLNEYVKTQAVSVETVQTSVNIEKKQKEFLDQNNLNLSEMTRDMIQEYMDKKGKKNENQSA